MPKQIRSLARFHVVGLRGTVVLASCGSRGLKPPATIRDSTVLVWSSTTIGAIAMLKRSVGLALLGSISFLMAACGSGMGTGTAAGGSSRTGGTTGPSGGETALVGSSSLPGMGGTTNGVTAPGGSTSVSGGTPSWAGGTTVASGGMPSLTGGTSAATGGSMGSTSATVVLQYTWMKQYGPPIGSSPWGERVIANADGTLTYYLMATTPINRSAVLTSSDLVEFDQFLQDPVLTTTLSDPTPCSTTTYWDASESVWLKFADGRPDVSKNIMDCTTAAYSGIRSWNGRLAGYFR